MILVASIFTCIYYWNACRMYQALLASGDRKSARIMLSKIPKDDIHVRCVIKACQTNYNTPKSAADNKKKKIKGKRWTGPQIKENEMIFTNVQFCSLERCQSSKALYSKFTLYSESYYEEVSLFHIYIHLVDFLFSSAIYKTHSLLVSQMGF